MRTWHALLLGAVLLVIGGVWVVVGRSADPAVGDVAWSAPREVASGAAHRGPWRMNDSDWRFVDDPTVALADDGTAAVLWVDHTRQDLFLQVYGPDGTPQLDAPTNVSRSPDTFSWLPRAVMPGGHADTLYVLWQEIIFSGGTHGGEAVFARSTDGGRSFDAPINLSRSKAGDGKGRLTAERWHNGSLDLAVGPDGAVHAAWTEYEGRLWLRRSTDAGASFADAVHVAGTAEVPARGPSVAVDPAGRVHLAWAVGADPAADIRYARSDPGGRSFASPRRIAASSGHSDAPSLVVDASGTRHLAYHERPNGPADPAHVRYLRAPADSAFGTPTVLSRRHAERYESAGYPTLQVGAEGRLYGLWELVPVVGRRSRALGFIASTDGGRTFGRPGVLPGSGPETPGFNGSQQGLLMEKLAANDAGGLAVVNSTFEPGEASHVWLVRGIARR